MDIGCSYEAITYQARSYNEDDASQVHISEHVFEVFPNPFKDEIIIINQDKLPQVISIFNIIGELIEEINLHGQETKKIDLSEYEPGIYIFNNGITSKKKIKI